MHDKYVTIKKDFLSGKIKGCKTYFEDNCYDVEAGYCYLILDNIQKAKELFLKAKPYNLRANWALFLIQMIEENICTYPAYLEIRNFLEIDINILLLYCKGDYIKSILKFADYMFFYNPETHKFLGRVFWANNYPTIAMHFLDLAKDKFFLDPELHYLLGYIYYSDNDYKNCKKSLDTCLEILPEYAPAVNLLKKI